MIKNHKGTLLITSAVILLPIVAGRLLWNDLPELIATHFNAGNQPDGYSSKAFAVFGLPCVVLGLHWIAVLATAADPRGRNISDKVLTLLFWICPSISLVLSAVTYGYAMGLKPNVGFIVMLLLGAIYLVLGNYLPKCGPNRSFGLRVSWTLKDPENWRRAHRAVGWGMTVGGALILATAWLQNPQLFFFILLSSVLAPAVYSYFCCRRN